MSLPIGLLLVFLGWATSSRPVKLPYPKNFQCPPNATTSFCSSRCEETCLYKSRGCPPRICGGPCVCRMGYIIDEQRSGCVLRKDCSEQQVEVPSYEVTSVAYFGANYGIKL
ncbi:hypothetical protein KR074_012054 [Drosophila pseudoananassae]|nr:hypothetical protein KR074_012054 [Drosophila pseudoananassae]